MEAYDEEESVPLEKAELTALCTALTDALARAETAERERDSARDLVEQLITERGRRWAAEAKLAAPGRGAGEVDGLTPADHLWREIYFSIFARRQHDEVFWKAMASFTPTQQMAIEDAATAIIDRHLTARDLAAAGREERMRSALERAERKLLAYVGVCNGDKELTDTVLPMVRAALSQPARAAQATAIIDLKHGGRDYSGDPPEKENDRG
jgi:hypothetical protein